MSRLRFIVRMLGGSPLSEEAGLIPRICLGLLSNVLQPEYRDNIDAKLSVSFVEIYNEKVFDLLSSSPGAPCRVREHPETGAYVENLTKVAVKSYSDVETVLAEGNSKRHVAATLMNSESSRSHAVFTICVQQKQLSGGSNVAKASKVCLIDLAGSERMATTGATGERLREASNINRSLSVLGDVLKALSEKSKGDKPAIVSSSKSVEFVPYRNSVLTWLLKDCLGGNSCTTMLATISPTDLSYSESINALRFVERTKYIVNKVSANVQRDENMKFAELMKQHVDLQAHYSALLDRFDARENEFKEIVSRLEVEVGSKYEEKIKMLTAELNAQSSMPADFGGFEANKPPQRENEEAQIFDEHVSSEIFCVKLSFLQKQLETVNGRYDSLLEQHR
jgi:hypothetical protein